MTNHEKQRVAEMRNRGMGYRDIASALNLTENCIKKYCQRNNLGVYELQLYRIRRRACVLSAVPRCATPKQAGTAGFVRMPAG